MQWYETEVTSLCWHRICELWGMVAQWIIFAFIVLLVIYLIAVYRRKRGAQGLPRGASAYLNSHVIFYKNLSVNDKRLFLQRVKAFLSRTAVTGVGIEITDGDRLLVAAGAIIPLFRFPEWEYRNIDEVLLYPDTFDADKQFTGKDRNILGMVGNGGMNGQMILSLPALRAGFARHDAHNTAIHEFAHLIDMADGGTDGVPEYLFQHGTATPWIQEMHRQIARIRNGATDINPYGATNEAEFFAVISEYFFERPEQLQEKHPELYGLLNEMYSGNK